MEGARRIADKFHVVTRESLLPIPPGTPHDADCPGCLIDRLLSEREAREEVLRLFADVTAWSVPEGDAERFGFEAGPWYFDPKTFDGNETPWELARAALPATESAQAEQPTSEAGS